MNVISVVLIAVAFGVTGRSGDLTARFENKIIDVSTRPSLSPFNPRNSPFWTGAKRGLTLVDLQRYDVARKIVPV